MSVFISQVSSDRETLPRKTNLDKIQTIHDGKVVENLGKSSVKFFRSGTKLLLSQKNKPKFQWFPSQHDTVCITDRMYDVIAA
jgi:hypothetical protein